MAIVGAVLVRCRPSRPDQQPIDHRREALRPEPAGGDGLAPLESTSKHGDDDRDRPYGQQRHAEHEFACETAHVQSFVADEGDHRENDRQREAVIEAALHIQRMTQEGKRLLLFVHRLGSGQSKAFPILHATAIPEQLMRRIAES